jgi:hypothetical protein
VNIWIVPFCLVLPSLLLAQQSVDFSLPDGPLTQERVNALFGDGKFSPTRGFAEIRDGVLEVTFVAGKKVVETGFSTHVPVPPSEDFELRFKIRYPEDFQVGLHGKQLGLSGGRGYDGGRGEEARNNGDGWSIRLQFDSVPEGVRNSLYVYHAKMSGKYGEPLGAGSFMLTRGRWHEIRLRVKMQTAPGSSDGVIEVWRDGEKKIGRTGFQLVQKEEGRRVDRVRIEMFPGGGGEFPAKDQVFEIDDVAWGPGWTTEPVTTWWEWGRGLIGW